jgi:hypothetical protein
MQTGGIDPYRFRSVAIWAPFLKAIPCAVLGGYFGWWLTRPGQGFGWIVTFFFASLWLLGGAAYLLAALLLSRRSLFWRLGGGIIDATATAIGALGFFWLAGRSAENVNSCCQGDPNAVPVVIFGAIAIVWIAASVPMLAWFVLGAAARFQQRRQQA